MIVGFFVFILGLCIGSFLNAFLYRYETKKKLSGRSICPKCGKVIAWYDNIPLLSYALLLGRCRKCRKTISIQYPLVEFLTGLSFLAVGVKTETIEYLNNALFEMGGVNMYPLLLNKINLIVLFIISSILIVIAIYDVKKKEIPNGFNLTFIVSSLLYLILSTYLLYGCSGLMQNILPFLLSGLVAFLFFYAFVYFSKETWMGGGDAKFALGMGIFLGPINTFLAVMFASWLGSIYGIGKLIMEKKGFRGNIKSHEIPFGPFLVIGTFIAFLFGSQLVSWYAKMFLGF
jgi:leader peptidase (prepilin peptidase)/N-methyltransferase